MKAIPATLSVLLTLTAMTVIGCAAPVEEDASKSDDGLTLTAAPTNEQAPLVASVTLSNGTRVEFRAIDGELLVVTDHLASVQPPAELERFERREIDGNMLYEALSGKRAPEALRSAVAAAKLAAAEPNGEADAESSSSLGIAASPNPQASCGWSAEGWDDEFCTVPGADVLYCHSIHYGNYYAKIHSLDMTFRVQAITHPLDVTFRYKKLGNWKQSYSFTVLPCHVKSMSGSGIRRDRKGEIVHNEEGYPARTQAFARVK